MGQTSVGLTWPVRTHAGVLTELHYSLELYYTSFKLISISIA